MFNAFNIDENDVKMTNGTNPFDIPSPTTDPFGIARDTKIPEASTGFNDNPFHMNKSNDTSIRPRSGKDALSSSNWLAYQHSMDEANLDSIEDLQDTSLITQTNNVNLNNPFSISTMPNTNQSNDITSQNFPMDLLFDTKIDLNTVPTGNSKNPFANPEQNSSSYDPFGLHQTNTSVTASSGNDSIIDASKPNQNQIFSSSSTTEKPLPQATITSAAPLTVLNTFGQSPVASQEISDVTSITGFNNQFADWFSQSDNFMSSIDRKTTETSTQNDMNRVKNTGDVFGNFSRPAATLSTLRMCYKHSYLDFVY